MTVPAQDRFTFSSGNGVTTTFPYTFMIPGTVDDPQFLVYLIEIATGTRTDLTVDVDYSISGLGVEEGGVVTYPLSGAPLPATHRIVIESNMPYEQQTDVYNSGTLYLKAIEDQFDNTTRQVQQIQDRVNRTFSVGIGYEGNYELFPVPDRLIGWNSTGTALENKQSESESAAAAYAAQLAAEAAAAAALAAAMALGWITPEHFGAVGDGVADDTAADNAARAAAGETGEVYYARTYRRTSILDVPQCRTRGPGTIVYNGRSWKAVETGRYFKPVAGRFGVSTIDDVEYCHLSNSPIVTHDGRIIIPYMQGTDHGQADTSAVCKPQSLAAAGALLINGNRASGGIATTPGTHSPGSRIQIVSTGDERGKTFTVDGFLNGVAVSEVINGPNAATATGSQRFTQVTAVVCSAATTGVVNVGFFELPSDNKLGISYDGGTTWDRLTIGDGRTRGDKRYYQISAGQRPNGEGFILSQRWDLVNPVQNVVRRTLDNWRTFGPEEVVQLDFTYVSTLYFWGNIKTLPSGKYVTGAYTSSAKYVLMSDDGVHWTASQFYGSGPKILSEPTLEVIDELNWIVLARVDQATSSMNMFKTTDGGETWTDMGGTNLPIGGGYVSPQLASLYVPGGMETAFVIGSRQFNNGAESPFAIIARFGKSSSLLAAATNWSDTDRIVASFAPPAWVSGASIVYDEYRVGGPNNQSYRALVSHTSAPETEPGVGVDWETYWVRVTARGGYPAPYIDPITGDGFVAYVYETGWRTSEIRFQRYNWRSVSIGDYYASIIPWTPTLEGGTTPGDHVLSTAYGRYTRIKNMVFLEFDIRVSGAFLGTGTATHIGGLPFTVLTANTSAGKARTFNAASAIPGVSVEGLVNTKKLNIMYEHSSNGYATGVQASQIGNDFRIEGSIVYMTDD